MKTWKIRILNRVKSFGVLWYYHYITMLTCIGLRSSPVALHRLVYITSLVAPGIIDAA